MLSAGSVVGALYHKLRYALYRFQHRDVCHHQALLPLQGKAPNEIHAILKH
jgi:hypothetical protein